MCDLLSPSSESSRDDDSVIICLFIVGASVPSPLMAVGTVIFIRLGDSSALFASFVASSIISRSFLFLSSFLFCRLVFSFFFRFLGLLSRRFCFRLLGRLFGRILVVSSVFFVFLYFLLFFILLSLLATLFLFLLSCPFLISLVTWFLPLVVSWCRFGVVLRLFLLFISSFVLFFPSDGSSVPPANVVSGVVT